MLKVVTLLSTLRDPTQLRRRQCATRQQHHFFWLHIVVLFRAFNFSAPNHEWKGYLVIKNKVYHQQSHAWFFFFKLCTYHEWKGYLVLACWYAYEIMLQRGKISTEVTSMPTQALILCAREQKPCTFSDLFLVFPWILPSQKSIFSQTNFKPNFVSWEYEITNQMSILVSLFIVRRSAGTELGEASGVWWWHRI